MPADRRSGDFGSKLREARERRGVSLRQIADATKISARVLEGLERNDISRLPGGIFGRAFVRSYASEVGLDPEKTIQEFIAAFPQDSVTAGHAVASPIEDHLAVESDRQTAKTFVRLIALSVPIVLVLYFGVTTRGGRDRPDPGTPGPTAPGSSVAPRPAVQSPPPAARTGRDAAEPAATVAPTAAPGGIGTTATDRLSVALSARRACWVSAEVDGRRVTERVLAAGERETLDVRRELALTVRDAAAIALTLNGSDARPLGKAGETVSVRINLTNFKDYLALR